MIWRWESSRGSCRGWKHCGQSPEIASHWALLPPGEDKTRVWFGSWSQGDGNLVEPLELWVKGWVTGQASMFSVPDDAYREASSIYWKEEGERVSKTVKHLKMNKGASADPMDCWASQGAAPVWSTRAWGEASCRSWTFFGASEGEVEEPELWVSGSGAAECEGSNAHRGLGNKVLIQFGQCRKFTSRRQGDASREQVPARLAASWMPGYQAWTLSRRQWGAIEGFWAGKWHVDISSWVQGWIWNIFRYFTIVSSGNRDFLMIVILKINTLPWTSNSFSKHNVLMI